ncbi:hypothetical protein ACVW0J_002790 [Bradyrhizobium sp. i1.7.7]
MASVSLKGHHLPGMIASSVGDALTSVMANANSRIEPIELAFIKQLSSEPRVSLGSQTIVVPAQSLTAASILIDDNGITFLGQINGERQQNQQPVGSTDFPGFKSAFLAKGAPLLTSAPKDGLVLSPDLVKKRFFWLRSFDSPAAASDGAARGCLAQCPQSQGAGCIAHPTGRQHRYRNCAIASEGSRRGGRQEIHHPAG